jgi:hypothetical protein
VFELSEFQLLGSMLFISAEIAVRLWSKVQFDGEIYWGFSMDSCDFVTMIQKT